MKEFLTRIARGSLLLLIPTAALLVGFAMCELAIRWPIFGVVIVVLVLAALAWVMGD